MRLATSTQMEQSCLHVLSGLWQRCTNGSESDGDRRWCTSYLEVEISERSQVLIDTHPLLTPLAGSMANVTLLKQLLTWAQLLGPKISEADFM